VVRLRCAAPVDPVVGASFSEITTDLTASYERLKEIDPVAANKIHPNDHRMVRIPMLLFMNAPHALPSDEVLAKVKFLLCLS